MYIFKSINGWCWLAIASTSVPRFTHFVLSAKDWMVEKAVPPMLNQMVLKPYGEMTNLKFDSQKRCVEAEVKLKGETEPVRIRIEEFDLREESGRMFVSAKAIETSREWLTTLAREHAAGRSFEIPESIRKYAKMLV